MAVSAIEQTISLLAGADLSAKQNFLVKVSTAADLTVLLGAANSDVILGVLLNKPASGQAASVQIGGVAKVVYGASVTRGDSLMSDTAGKAITATGTNPILGVALSSGSAGETHTVALVNRPLTAGVAGSVLCIPVTLASIADGTIATYTPGFAGTIKKVTYVPSVIASTASKLSTITPKIGSTPVTGGVLSLTTVACGTLGTNVDGTAVTGANSFISTDAINLVASSTTAFTQGSGAFLIQLG